MVEIKKIIAVGFKVDEENSKFYKKYDVENIAITEKDKDRWLSILKQSILTNCDFISIRFKKE